MRSKITFLIIIVFILSVCGSSPVRIINHESPNLQADISPFTNAGCKSLNGNDWYLCEAGSPLLELGCTAIENKPLLGGLTPSHPIAACNLEMYEPIAAGDYSSDCFYLDGAAIKVCHRLVIYRDGKYEIVKTMDELRRIFAPVDSPDEALSFALAAGHYFASYGQTVQDDLVYSTRILEDTRVETGANGYLVQVFSTKFVGCGPFDTSAVVIKVTKDGKVEEVSRTPVYRDPSLDNTCAD